MYGCNSDPKVDGMNQLGDFVQIRKEFCYGPTRDYWDHRTSSPPSLCSLTSLS